ncbi:efflux transporter outer membrane subunit [Sphingomonas flavalba]|uniref:efflux transporter outer membrane subunit n=1 Tax=Sphingomonas flavalba TaxID=2559804 RepID=UPI0039E14C63
MPKPGLLLLPLLLAGCAAGPDYARPQPAALGVPDAYHAASPAGTPGDLTQWWTLFGDPVLTGLVDQALAGNLDIAQGEARLRQAREALVQARADLLPSLDASAGGGRNFDNSAPDTSRLSLGADAAWQLDLFGGVRRSVEAARADSAASAYDLEAVRIAIAGEVARNYVLARQAQASLAIARDTLVTQDDNLEIAGFRVQAGLVSSLDQEQARQQRASTAASIPGLEQSFAAAANRLAVLTGQAPGAVTDRLTVPGAIPEGPEAVAAGIPADTLRQRPDVRGAERGLAAATARIGVARAALLPGLGISGNVGTSALRLGGLGDVITGGLFANLSQILFDGGRRQAAARAQQAAADGAFAAYKATVLTALEDVENGLVALRAARERETQIAISLDASTNAALLARSQYRAGLTDFRTLLDAERSLLSARDGFNQAKADAATALVQLYLALGGGWQPADLPNEGS